MLSRLKKRRYGARRAGFNSFHEPSHCSVKFCPILQRVSEPIRKVRKHDTDALCKMQAFLIGLCMKTFAKRRRQKSQRVLTLDQQALRNAVPDLIHGLA